MRNGSIEWIPEIHDAVQKPVVQRLLKLMEFRNTYPAFHGSFKVHDSKTNEIILSWQLDDFITTAYIDLVNYQTKITYNDQQSGKLKTYRV